MHECMNARRLQRGELMQGRNYSRLHEWIHVHV